MHKSKDCDWSMLYWLCSHWSDFTETRLTDRFYSSSVHMLCQHYADWITVVADRFFIYIALYLAQAKCVHQQ